MSLNPLELFPYLSKLSPGVTEVKRKARFRDTFKACSLQGEDSLGGLLLWASLQGGRRGGTTQKKEA